MRNWEVSVLEHKYFQALSILEEHVILANIGCFRNFLASKKIMLYDMC